MTSSLDTTGPSRGDRMRQQSFLREFLPAIAAYVLVLVPVLIFGRLDGTQPWRFAWALLPVVPMAWVIRAVSRHLTRSDEYQQRLQLQGLGVGFAAAMLASITAGFLGIAGLDMRLSGWLIYAVGMAGWIVGAATASRAASRRRG